MDLSKALKLLMKLRCKSGNTEGYRVSEGLLDGMHASLQAPCGTSDTEVGRGRRGAVESPMFFAALVERVLEDAGNKYAWRSAVSPYPYLQLGQTAYMHVVILWDGSTKQLSTRIIQLSAEFAECGLSVNIRKRTPYTSPDHNGPSFSIKVYGERLNAALQVNLMQVDLKVGASIRDLLASTWEQSHDMGCA